MGSGVAVCSSRAQAQWLWHMDLVALQCVGSSRPGIKLTPPTLAGGFSPLSHQEAPDLSFFLKPRPCPQSCTEASVASRSSTHPCSLGWCLAPTMDHPRLALPCPVSFPVATHTHTHTRLNHPWTSSLSALLTLCPLPRVALPKASNPMSQGPTLRPSSPDPTHLQLSQK